MVRRRTGEMKRAQVMKRRGAAPLGAPHRDRGHAPRSGIAG